MNKIWISDQKKYSRIFNESRKYLLHPKIIKLVNEYKPKKIIDYGCGEGRLIENLDRNLDISLFDISKNVIEVVKKKFDKRISNYYKNSKEIPSNKFDLVIFSLVLMTIKNEEEIKNTLNDILRIKTKNGKVIIAITHPCFRQYKFSSFYTEFTNDSLFNYFKEGQKFKVTLKDLSNQKKISFYDYHWSLSKTINLCIDCGLKIVRLLEIKDIEEKPIRKKVYCPPYLIIICK